MSPRSIRARKESEKPKMGNFQKPIDGNRSGKPTDSHRWRIDWAKLSIPTDSHRWKFRDLEKRSIDWAKLSIPIDSHR
ncbi:hypothetical protein CASFOL_022774 [Castilleja foliolosa]|uniref:Uncharacterized protein n=1 Tax=Castilleja foliolosa TaxID=1961234 RepID=A0ABD3CUT3_9LAMI